MRNKVAFIAIGVRVLKDNINKTIASVHLAMKNRLNSSGLTNKQKAELLAVAEIEAFRIIDALIKSIERSE